MSAPASTKNTFETRSRSRPLRSSASMVLPKLGAAGSAAMASISARWRGESAVEGGPEMLGRDGAERRQAEGAGPVGKQRILVSESAVIGGLLQHLLRLFARFI